MLDRTLTGAEQGKRRRTSWSGSLQAAFEKAVDELGPNATPNPIKDVNLNLEFVKLTLFCVETSWRRV